MRRKHITDRTRLAASLCALLELPHDIAKAMTEDEIIGLVQWDHYPIRHADGGPGTHWNLVPRFRQDHIEKTRRDTSDMAKERKVRRAQAHHEDTLVIKSADPSSTILSALKPMEWTRWPAARWQKPKRPWPSRKIASRPFQKRRLGR